MKPSTARGANHAPVLIVGAGPVGLALALELAYRDIRCILIDQGDGVVRYSKMGHVSVRSMEHCRRWGVAENVRNCGFPRDYPLNQVFCTSLNGQHITTLEYPSIADEPVNEFSPETKQRCPQLWFDPILARAAATRPGIDIRYSTRLKSLQQGANRVTAVVEDLASGTTETITADYLAGCDGAGSPVRQALDIALEGDAVLSYSVGIYFTAPDLIRHHHMGPGSRYWLVGEEGTWGNLTVVDAKDVWRLTIIGGQEKVEAKDFDADYWLQRCLGSKDIEYRIDAVLPWRRSRLVAQRYGHERVFLAGDACHVNAPNGGYGMNTGLGDAVDLGWKLEAVLKGWGSPALLSAYEMERRPIGQRAVNAAAMNFTLTRPKLSYRNVESAGPEGDATRAALARAMGDDTRQEFETLGVHLGYRYEGSPIVWADGTPEPPDHLSDYVPSSRPGHRAPHVTLADGRSILDLFGRCFALLRFGDAVSDADESALDSLQAAARRLGVPFEIHTVPGQPAHQLYERRFVLVRPDGHVAWRSDAVDVEPDELLGRVCGRQLTSKPTRAEKEI